MDISSVVIEINIAGKSSNASVSDAPELWFWFSSVTNPTRIAQLSRTYGRLVLDQHIECSMKVFSFAVGDSN